MALAEVGGAVAARHSPPATHTTPGARQRVLVERGPLRRGGDRTALSGSARALMQPHPGGVTRPSSTSSPGVPRRRRATSTSPTTPQRRGSDNRESPSEGLLRGFHAVRYQASKPDIGAGHIAVNAIPGPKPVSGVANSLVGVGVPCSADQIVPPHPFRPTATVADGELHCADPVRAESGAQQ